MDYQWKTGYFSKVKAQAAGEELERIVAEGKPLKAGVIVDESRPDTAVLHNCFDWDDKSAAEKHRQHQARVLVGNLVTVKICESDESEDSVVQIRAYHHVADEYRHVSAIKSRRDYSDELTGQMIRDIEQFQAKYQNYEDYYEESLVEARVGEMNSAMSHTLKTLRSRHVDNAGVNAHATSAATA